MDIQLIIAKIRRWLSKPQNPNSFNYYHIERGEGEITSYKSTIDIFKSGQFTPTERRAEYRRRGKSPSGVIDGVYNDLYLEPGASYNDMDRDWEAGA